MLAGTLSTPLLMTMLSNKLLAQSDDVKQSIIWIQGQSGGKHQAGIWSYPGFYSSLARHFTLFTADTPDIQAKAIDFSDMRKPHILILEGYFSQDLDDPLNNLLKDLIVVSRAVILLGNEAAYGEGQVDGFINLETELLQLVETPYLKLPGNPVPARHLIGTLNHMVMYDFPRLDEYRRPELFYSQTICDRCQYRGDFERGNFIRYFGQGEGCLYMLGCKGPVTKNTCAIEKWNGTSSWCVSAGSPCTGCSEPAYPDNNGLGLYGQLTSDSVPINSFFIRNASTIAQGAFAVTIAGVAIHAFSGRRSAIQKDQEVFTLEEEEND